MGQPCRETEEPDIQLADLSIWIRSYEFPDSLDYWDGNWLDIYAHVKTPGAFVEIEGPWVRNDELTRFTKDLAVLHNDLKGTATLDCIEPALGAKVTCGSLGHIEVVVKITPDHLRQTHQFIFEIDQSYLSDTLSGLERVLERFPIRGTP